MVYVGGCIGGLVVYMCQYLQWFGGDVWVQCELCLFVYVEMWIVGQCVYCIEFVFQCQVWVVVDQIVGLVMYGVVGMVLLVLWIVECMCVQQCCCVLYVQGDVVVGGFVYVVYG